MNTCRNQIFRPMADKLHVTDAIYGTVRWFLNENLLAYRIGQGRHGIE
ncbi:MAG: hypothetical protein ABQ298_03415 [Puniceicoccaceae bacterium]